MAKVLGLGGIFFKSDDPEALGEWYKKWLNMPIAFPGGAVLPSAQVPKEAYSVWSAFPKDTDYMDPSPQPFMFNLMVDDVDEALKQVQEGGATIAGEIEESEYGRFGWFIDPDGNKVELWKPPAAK